jgi:hypothetical protein
MADTAPITTYVPKDKKKALRIKQASIKKKLREELSRSNDSGAGALERHKDREVAELQRKDHTRATNKEHDRIINQSAPNHRKMYEIEGAGQLRKETKERKKLRTLMDE